MFLLFFFSYVAAHIMLFATLIRAIAVHSGALNYLDNSRIAHKMRRTALRKQWLITLLLFAIAAYAGINL